MASRSPSPLSSSAPSSLRSALRRNIAFHGETALEHAEVHVDSVEKLIRKAFSGVDGESSGSNATSINATAHDSKLCLTGSTTTERNSRRCLSITFQHHQDQTQHPDETLCSATPTKNKETRKVRFEDMQEHAAQRPRRRIDPDLLRELRAARHRDQQEAEPDKSVTSDDGDNNDRVPHDDGSSLLKLSIAKPSKENRA